MQKPLTTSVGTWAGVAFAALNLSYLCTLTITMVRGLPFPPPEPYTTVFHVLNLLAPLAVIPLWGAIHLAAPAAARLGTLTSLSFATIFASLVVTNRFVALTMVRQSEALGQVEGLAWFQPYGWPSLMFTLELLGWGVFFSLACLFQVFAFRAGRLERTIATVFAVTGLLSLTGGAGGLLLGSTDLMGLVAPVAWGIGPILATILVIAWLRRSEAPKAKPDTPGPDRLGPDRPGSDETGQHGRAEVPQLEPDSASTSARSSA